MVKAPSMYPDIGDETDFRLNRINEIKYYFTVEIPERESMSKRFSK